MVWGHAAVCVSTTVTLKASLIFHYFNGSFYQLRYLLYLDSYRLLAKLKASTVRADFGAHNFIAVYCAESFSGFPGCPVPLVGACHYFQLILTVVS